MSMDGGGASLFYCVYTNDKEKGEFITVPMVVYFTIGGVPAWWLRAKIDEPLVPSTTYLSNIA